MTPLHYELTLAHYRGPIEELLALIEERKLEINEISMAQVTDDFLRYLETITADYRAERATGAAALSYESGQASAYMRLLADFIVVASRLILIKSKSLLPDAQMTPEDEADIKDLETRLAAYREFKPAIRLLHDLWRKGNRGMSRPYFLHIKGFLLRMHAEGVAPSLFQPGSSLTKEALAQSLAGVQAIVKKEIEEETLVQKKIITLEEKIGEIIARMNELKETSFSRLSDGSSRAEAVVAFLAVLHLAREQMVFLEQENGDSDIIIKGKSAM